MNGGILGVDVQLSPLFCIFVVGKKYNYEYTETNCRNV